MYPKISCFALRRYRLFLILLIIAAVALTFSRAKMANANAGARVNELTAQAFGPLVAPTAMTFTVTTTDDHDDGACDVDCTLREAINAANANPDTSTINIGSTLFAPLGPHTINLTGVLPDLN